MITATYRTAAAAAALLLVVHFALPRTAAAQDLSRHQARQVDDLFAQYNRAPSPGLALAVVRDGKVLLAKGYGLASLEHGVPITSSTVFDIASVSKQFAGLAVAMLVQDGRIKLTDDVRKYIPELADFGHTITVDHLVHHTSGIRDWPATLAIAGWRFDDVISYDQILAMAYRQRTLNFVPGAEYTYSNTGYNLLAEIVARVTGRSFREWTTEHLFWPLGMTNTQFQDDHTRVLSSRAFGYARSRDGEWRSTPDNLTAVGSSSLFSTVDDLAKWIINFDGARVGGPAAMTLTRTRGVLNDGAIIPYAFGVSHGEYGGLPTVAHTGSWAQFRSYLVHFPQQRFGVVVLANSGSIDPQRAANRVIDIFLEKELSRPRTAGAAPAAVDVSTQILADYVGYYRLGPGWYVRIRQDGPSLKAQATREEEVPMTPRSRTEFWVEAYGAAMAFERADSTGPITHVRYRGLRAPRVDAPVPPRSDRFAELAGRYESEELGTWYDVEANGDSLALRHHRHGRFALMPLARDEFSAAAGSLRWAVEFQRDHSGKVTGLLINAGERSRNNRFAKRR